MTKALPWTLFGLTLLAAVYLFVQLLNAGAALDNARSQTSSLRERSELSLEILRKEMIGRDSEKILALSNQLKQEGVVVGTENDAFQVGDIIFEIRNGVVSGVRYFD